MSNAAATNPVTRPANFHANSQQFPGITVNASIPVGGMEPWRLEAIQKVIGFSGLQQGWDGRGSRAPAWAVRQAAIDFLLNVPGENFPAPRVVPVSGGGYHFEWSDGQKDLEISIEPECRIEALRVEQGVPIENDPMKDLPAIFGWLAAR